jgi:predicted metallopeptidase
MGEILTLARGGIRTSPPLVLRWGGADEPLPILPVRGSPHWALGLDINADVSVGPFDFTGAVRQLCSDIVFRCPGLAHVDPTRVLFGFTQARNGRAHGLQARVTPLRFHNGLLIRRHRGVPYQVQRYVVDGFEMLYLMTFCLPRFLNQAFEDKLVTLFHELYHIGPRFDGDLRRHDGRYSIHSHSQRCYDEHMAKLARGYLATDADPDLHRFLRLSFRELRQKFGAVVGVVVPRPKLVPLAVETY